MKALFAALAILPAAALRGRRRPAAGAAGTLRHRARLRAARGGAGIPRLVLRVLRGRRHRFQPASIPRPRRARRASPRRRRRWAPTGRRCTATSRRRAISAGTPGRSCSRAERPARPPRHVLLGLEAAAGRELQGRPRHRQRTRPPPSCRSTSRRIRPGSAGPARRRAVDVAAARTNCSPSSEPSSPTAATRKRRPRLWQPARGRGPRASAGRHAGRRPRRARRMGHPRRARSIAGEPLFADVARSGDLGYAWGSYEQSRRCAGGRLLTRASGRRIAKGEWRIVMDTVSPVPEGVKPLTAELLEAEEPYLAGRWAEAEAAYRPTSTRIPATRSPGTGSARASCSRRNTRRR